MMQASHFPPQPGMQMAQGHMMGGPGPGHPMQPGMQMHPGVSGPNGPVSQAGPMMGGMQPGIGPNAHALSHLQPQQQHMFSQQQQQQQHMMNPALMAQQRNAQQALMVRQHAQQQQQQQQQQMLAQQNGMANMNFQQHMAGMNPQQLAALQSNMGQPYAAVNLPAHLRQQMTQQQAMQAQQQQTSNPQQAAAMAHAQAQAQAQQAQHQAQAQAQHQQQQRQQLQAHQQQQQQQQTQPQLQQQQQQQQQPQQQPPPPPQQAIQMQHAVSQQSNHSQPGSQGPPTSQPAQAPLRPPSAMSHQGQASPAAQPTPQQKPQQLPQSGPQPPQQTAAPNQPPDMPQQPNAQAPNQPQMQQRNPAMSQPPTPAQIAQQLQNSAQQQAARLSMIQQQRAASGGGQPTVKLVQFVNELGAYHGSRDPNNSIQRWQSLVEKFFTETGSFINVIWSNENGSRKMFEIVYAALPRYFYTQFSTDVEHMQITLDGATEKSNPTESKVTCDRSKIIYTYKNQCQVVFYGQLTAFWSGNEKMEWLQFETQSFQQLIPRALLEPLFVQEEVNTLNPNQSPRMNNKAKQKQRAAQMSAEPSLPYSKLPGAPITEFGLPPLLQSYLEVYENMNHMSSLLNYYHAHEELTPSQAMVQWNNMMSASNPQIAQQAAMRMQGANMAQGQGMTQPGQQGMPPGSRTPSGMGQPGMPPNQQFMSPAMANSLLPNGSMSSPHLMQNHTPSPASHAMAHQQSQTGSSASQNTSPNMSNKRRRSTANGDDGGGPDVNGAAKVKQSPRPGNNKRVKNTN